MDHMKNILVGGALGIIIGVAIVAVNQADMSRDSYLKNAGYRSDPASLRPLQQDRREGRLRRALAQKGQLISTPLFFNYSLTF
ncbi:MAG: hypothetical protein HN730_07440 [Bdellovibrionales bacterium]|nr:hypothetical protein [Bdellovibrionales bacterium]